MMLAALVPPLIGPLIVDYYIINKCNNILKQHSTIRDEALMVNDNAIRSFTYNS